MKLEPSTQRPGNGPAVRRGEFRRWERTGSAENPWISGCCAPKSLIPEASAAMSQRGFATSRATFAMSPVSPLAGDAPFFPLSNSLKKKKKEYEEGQGIGHYLVPRVGVVLPSVAHAAYFLGHGFSGVATGEWWQLVAQQIFNNQQVMVHIRANHHSTSCAACTSFSRGR